MFAGNAGDPVGPLGLRADGSAVRPANIPIFLPPRPGGDWIGTYKDVGAVLIDLEHIERPLVSVLNLCTQWVGDHAIRTSPDVYPFERKIFPPVSST